MTKYFSREEGRAPRVGAILTPPVVLAQVDDAQPAPPSSLPLKASHAKVGDEESIQPRLRKRPIEDLPQSHNKHKQLLDDRKRLHQSRSEHLSKDTEQVSFLRGDENHIAAYVELINSAKSQIIIASWKLQYISENIFQSLRQAKRKGVYISFIVNSVLRRETLDFFSDDDDSEDPSFAIAETQSHAKFLFVDSEKLIIGSFNALTSVRRKE
ncbi:MAG TPA: phospholipase D-like domain-containing protein [Alphaproteobacteria bacterium]|nr:phospholipase D-like domain-containing protein [Alphaproteobacteria bacterium]HQS94057.1 phospholipase D-like domain-containing protein [Alphaproteobacteria bacterium]